MKRSLIAIAIGALFMSTTAASAWEIVVAEHETSVITQEYVAAVPDVDVPAVKAMSSANPPKAPSYEAGNKCRSHKKGPLAFVGQPLGPDKICAVAVSLSEQVGSLYTKTPGYTVTGSAEVPEVKEYTCHQTGFGSSGVFVNRPSPTSC